MTDKSEIAQILRRFSPKSSALAIVQERLPWPASRNSSTSSNGWTARAMLPRAIVMTSDQLIGAAFAYEAVVLVFGKKIEKLTGIKLHPITKVAVRHPMMAAVTEGILAWHLDDYYQRNHTHE